ncbi:hypothetical protein HII13_002051 [Brettanomyces bruxellensis]|nr:hypothetical protein HII13_002051 [Brettanomyces bruxellensis]
MATAKETTGEKTQSSHANKALAASAIAGVTATTDKELAPDGYPKDCPADVEELGRSTWTFLHTVAATYPESATEQQQKEMKAFLETFSKIYPCWFCAKGFRKYIKANEPKVMTQDEFGRWLCDAHNAVNKKLGKPHFDCNLWKKRWKDGWGDGKCD